jgi:hypothetical protein
LAVVPILLCKQGVVGSNPIVSTTKALVRGHKVVSGRSGFRRRSHFGRSLFASWLRRGVTVARKPSVRWNESKQRWMAWVRFADGTRRKVERSRRPTPRPTSTSCWHCEPRSSRRSLAARDSSRSTRCSTTGSRPAARTWRRRRTLATPGRSRATRSPMRGSSSERASDR